MAMQVAAIPEAAFANDITQLHRVIQGWAAKRLHP